MTDAGKREDGFTLIELLVAILVLVILATIAVPGFNSIIDRNRFASDYNEVVSGLLAARSESVMRRDRVAFLIQQDAGGPWEYAVVSDGGDGEELVLRGSRDERVLLLNADGSSLSDFEVVFNSLGRRISCKIDGVESSSCRLRVDLANKYSRSVVIGRNGRFL